MSFSGSFLRGGQRYPLQLSQDELQKYPDSLLAQMADSGTNGVIDLDNQPNNPLQDFLDPSAAIISLYRHGRFDEDFANHLASCQCQGQCQCLAAETSKIAYSKAKDLLSYLGLPGPVSAWLPDIRNLSLRSTRTAMFAYRTIATETVDSIMNFHAFKGPMALSHAPDPLVLLISEPETGASGQLQLPKVYTLVPSCKKLVEWLSSICSSGKAWDNNTIAAECSAVGLMMDSTFCLEKYEQCKMLPPSETIAYLADVVGLNGCKIIGASHCYVGCFIKEELQSACKEAHLAAGCVDVCIVPDAGGCETWVSVWCLKW